MYNDVTYRSLTRAEIKARTYDAEGNMLPEFEAFYSAIDCPNFDDRSAGRCWLSGMTVEEAGESLRADDEENQRDQAAIWRSERAYYDDQVNH